MSAEQPLLSVRDLTVTFRVRGRGRQVIHAVNGVSFDIAPGENLALVGESGSGKSTTARGILGLVPRARGTVEVEGVDITKISPRDLKSARKDMQMVFQDPYSSLNPIMTVGEAIAEPLRVHTKMNKFAQRERVLELLALVGLHPDHFSRYPYEFSGGQRQRIAIARAVAANPKLVIADEAVSALDASSQNQIIRLLERLAKELDIGYLFISHDLAVVRHIADRVAVMYLGRLVESGPTDALFTAPNHPYTEALLSSALLADPVRQAERHKVVRVTGEIPDPSAALTGCAFRSRCPYVMEICHEEVPLPTPRKSGGHVSCHLQTSGPLLEGKDLSVLSQGGKGRPARQGRRVDDAVG